MQRAHSSEQAAAVGSVVSDLLAADPSAAKDTHTKSACVLFVSLSLSFFLSFSLSLSLSLFPSFCFFLSLSLSLLSDELKKVVAVLEEKLQERSRFRGPFSRGALCIPRENNETTPKPWHE